MYSVKIVDRIDLNAAYAHLQSPGAGAMNLFVGTVRDYANGKKVVKLVFEGYEPMAIKEMQRLAALAAEKWDLEKVVLEHVLGERKIGEAVVLVGVAAPHRKAAFEANRFLIDELKQTVPIWKKEFYEDGSIWVNAHP